MTLLRLALCLRVATAYGLTTRAELGATGAASITAVVDREQADQQAQHEAGMNQDEAGMDVPHAHQCYCRVSRHAACQQIGSNQLQEKAYTTPFEMTNIKTRKTQNNNKVYCCKTFTSERDAIKTHPWRRDTDATNFNSPMCNYHVAPRVEHSVLTGVEATPALDVTWAPLTAAQEAQAAAQGFVLASYQARTGCQCNLNEHPHVEVGYGPIVQFPGHGLGASVAASLPLPTEMGECRFVSSSLCGPNVMAVFHAQGASGKRNGAYEQLAEQNQVHSSPSVLLAARYEAYGHDWVDVWPGTGAESKA